MKRGVKMQAKDIMVTEVVTVKKDDTVEDVIKLLIQHNISGLPVVDEEGRVTGIVTEGDLIYRSKKLHIPAYFTILDGYIFLESTKSLEEEMKKIAAYRVEDMMTQEVITVGEEESVEEIATTMIRKKINRLPVVRDGKLVGIVSRRDIIKAYVRE